jgi:hypothetical protein
LLLSQASKPDPWFTGSAQRASQRPFSGALYQDLTRHCPLKIERCIDCN